MTIVATYKAALEPLFAARHPGDARSFVYRAGTVPVGAPMPYATIHDPISATPSLSGDARTAAWRTLVQVSIFQELDVEDDTLLGAALAALNGLHEATTGHTSTVTDYQRLVENEAGKSRIVHHPLTVRVQRRRGA